MAKIIMTMIGGETKMIPVKVVTVPPSVTYYTDPSDKAKPMVEENIGGKSSPDTPHRWFYQVRRDAIRRHRSIKDYLLFINHAF